jgi:hypothetical protein
MIVMLNLCPFPIHQVISSLWWFVTWLSHFLLWQDIYTLNVLIAHNLSFKEQFTTL